PAPRPRFEQRRSLQLAALRVAPASSHRARSHQSDPQRPWWALPSVLLLAPQATRLSHAIARSPREPAFLHRPSRSPSPDNPHVPHRTSLRWWLALDQPRPEPHAPHRNPALGTNESPVQRLARGPRD